MNDNDIVIVAAKRTPHGNMLGALASLSASELGAVAIKAAMEQANLPDSLAIDEVMMGCVLQAGQGQAPARQAALKAGLANHTPATTLNKMCGSGMKALMLGHDLIKAGSITTALCGGLESMSNAPYLLKRARQGYRLGHSQMYDHMFLDGLEDAYNPGQLMGVFAEATAEKYQFTRDAQDAFALTSLTRALKAQKANLFSQEIAPVEIADKDQTRLIDTDEGPDEKKLAKIPRLKPAFKHNGTVTAANASSISDGASCLLLMNYKTAKANHLEPLARICGHTTFAHAPEWFTTAPISAIQSVLKKVQWRTQNVDLYEINEAFAVVTMAAIQALELDADKVNSRGGACALGHPIGASGARIVTTLLYALKPGQKGIAALCIGGGEATAMAIERF